MHPLDIVFWTCLMLGGAYTVITLLMGGLSHAAGHASGAIHHIGDALHLPLGDGSAGHVGHGAQVSHGAHAPTHGAGHGAHHHGHAHAHAHHHADHTSQADGDGDGDTGRGFNILAYLNPASLSGFFIGFGGTGVITRLLKVPETPSLLYATAGGCGLWVVSYFLVTRMFGAAQGTSHNRRDDVIGIRAQTSVAISGRTPGMVSYTVAGNRQSLRAITDEEETIPVGAAVRIRKIENNTAYVVRSDY